jgi:predicted nucleotidyltransferase
MGSFVHRDHVPLSCRDGGIAMTGVKTAIPVDRDAIARFCHTWQIKEFALFGSVLTDQFRADSDVDVLVTFEEPTPWSLFDVVDMKDELERLFGRKVDFVEKAAIRNPWRRRSILASYRVIYAA